MSYVSATVGFLKIALFVSLVIVSIKETESRVLHYDRSSPVLDSDDNHTIEVLHRNEVVSNTLTPDGHFKEITVTVSAFGRKFYLDLKINRYLFAVGFIQKSITQRGEVYHAVNHTEDHCYYLGIVRDHPDSSAAVSTCSGIVGYFVVGNVSYHIDPIGNHVRGPHKVYRSRHDSKTPFSCGFNEVPLDTLFNPATQKNRLKRSFMWPQDRDKKTKVVELYIANDKSQYVARGNNADAVLQRAKAIVNTASITFQSVDIYLVLVGIEVWSDRDRITVDPNNIASTLDRWATYRMTNINPFHYNDNGVLITNNKFPNGNTVLAGVAHNGVMCSNRYSAAIVGDIDAALTVASTLMNHEMGHNFNLSHDDDVRPCPCSDPTTHCIMYSSTDSGAPTKTWSQCSMEALGNTIQHGLDICLYNIPQTVYETTPNCGNGIVDDGEQCDCGNSTSDECNKGCCNAMTCQLIAPAECAFGRCCNINTCKRLACGETCRPKAGDCDLAEYCSGQDGRCPSDTHKPDGTNCIENGTAAYCYSGLCRSRESQCQVLWGPGALVSDNICYTDYNQRGIENGNCGVNWLPTVTYIPCQISNVYCGMLQCQNNPQQKLYYYQYNIFKQGAVQFNGGSKPTCRTVIFDMGLAIQDPGLVPNGASCGAGKMCLNQVCINVTSVSSTPCATACLPNQVCNNLGQCQNTTTDCPKITTTTSTTRSTLSMQSSSTVKLSSTVGQFSTVPTVRQSTLTTAVPVTQTVISSVAAAVLTFLAIAAVVFLGNCFRPGLFPCCPNPR